MNSLTAEKSLQQALAHIEAGQLHDALSIYHTILKAMPNLPEANHNLGILLVQLEQPTAGLYHLKAALEANPDQAQYWLSYAEALIITSQPDLARRVLELGKRRGLQGRTVDVLVERLATFTQANPFVTASEEEIDALVLIFKERRYIDAERLSRMMTERSPQEVVGWKVLGASLRQLGRAADAVSPMQRAVALSLFDAQAQTNLGLTLGDLGCLAEAEVSYRTALQINPIFAEALNYLGNTLWQLKRGEDAVVCYKKALVINPDYADAHFNLGTILHDLGQSEPAVTSIRKALEINPDFAKANFSLGAILRDLGQFADAESCYRRALELKPDYVDAHSNLLYLHAFTRSVSPEAESRLAADWENTALSESERIAARNRALLFDEPTASHCHTKTIRIGVVSAEIGQHPVAEFLEPFLRELDRRRFHITLFPTTARKESRAAQLIKLADACMPLVDYSDSEAATLIRARQIDILIDTTGHMKGCRLGIFAHRAAPVQCHYIGYHGTTGLTEMDWFIADEVLLPNACDTHFCEGIWRLPRLWIAYNGDTSLPNSHWKPSFDGTVWLGTFNNILKVNGKTLSLWAKVMNAIPESKLFLKCPLPLSALAQERIRMELYSHGVVNERVTFGSITPGWSSHMAMYDQLDIALDTIPLNSGTTAFDALWMGVPLVALEGNWMGGRMSSTILRALGKPEWVAQTEDQYVNLVASLAKDVDGRRLLRTTQRTLMAKSLLCDAKGITLALQDAFENMLAKCRQRNGVARVAANNAGT